jgi:hypothetical protein
MIVLENFAKSLSIKVPSSTQSTINKHYFPLVLSENLLGKSFLPTKAAYEFTLRKNIVRPYLQFTANYFHAKSHYGKLYH